MGGIRRAHVFRVAAARRASQVRISGMGRIPRADMTTAAVRIGPMVIFVAAATRALALKRYRHGVALPAVHARACVRAVPERQCPCGRGGAHSQVE